MHDLGNTPRPLDVIADNTPPASAYYRSSDTAVYDLPTAIACQSAREDRILRQGWLLFA